jgi:hypothetical protein
LVLVQLLLLRVIPAKAGIHSFGAGPVGVFLLIAYKHSEFTKEKKHMGVPLAGRSSSLLR